VAGIIFVTGREKLSDLGGLIYKMPQSFVLLLIGIIVLAGMPPLGGFASKFMIYTSLLDAKYLLLLSAVMFSSASAFLYIYKLIYGIYLGHPTHKKLESAKEVPYSFLIPQYLLSLLLITIGTFPALVVPYLNAVLRELHINPIVFTDMATLITPHAQYNGFIVMAAFAAIFVLVLLVFVSLRPKAKNVKNRFDIAYCGEEPNEASHLHYGYSMGKELKRVGFINMILKNSTRYMYDYLARQTLSFSEILRKIYSGNISLSFNIAIGFLLILLWWSLK
jgi:NADH-quinone oxidoreductase subunit M